jgi:hypothetical protein
MTGKFLKRGAIIDTKKSEERVNALQKRSGGRQYHVRVTSCGCPDPNCGAFHVLESDRPLPNAVEVAASLRRDSKYRKLAGRSGPAQQAAARNGVKKRGA